MRRDSSCSSGGKTEDSLGRACSGPPGDDAKAHRTWDRDRRSSSSSSSPPPLRIAECTAPVPQYRQPSRICFAYIVYWKQPAWLHMPCPRVGAWT